MSTREKLYTGLIRELLGPRNGVSEIISNDPRKEYMAGVLEPASMSHKNLLDFGISDVTGVMAEEEGEEDTDEIQDYFKSSPITTTLHHEARPKTIGISFILSSSFSPILDLCLTWARYRYKKEESGWHREPYFEIIRDVKIEEPYYLSIRSKRDPEVLFVVRSYPISENKLHVSVFIVNESRFEGIYPETENYLFQPQIRVNVDRNSKIEMMEMEKMEDSEEKHLSIIYRKLSSYGRGHFCGAIWKEIDPARPVSSEENYSRLTPEDIINLPDEIRSEFILPDVRTEFLPSYSVNQSTVDTSLFGINKDEFNASLLSEINSSDITIPFEKLHRKYSEWINKQEMELNLVSQPSSILKKNLDSCRRSMDRIYRGIDLIKKDERIRLAFMFMNKSMNTQYRWNNKNSDLVWRPFQIAFILQCIESIVNRNSDDRGICDLLWYPTGGGKTEAYLGLIIFCLALRRLSNDPDSPSQEGTGVISRYTLRLLTIQQFRRTLKAIMAAEYLRVTNWHPGKSDAINNRYIWGNSRFSIGLWVGQSVTPNDLTQRKGWDDVKETEIIYPGAIDILQNIHKMDHLVNVEKTDSEPAQVIKCPCCYSLLSIPNSGIPGSIHTIFWIIKAEKPPEIVPKDLNLNPFTVIDARIVCTLPNRHYHVLKIEFKTNDDSITDEKIRAWWIGHITKKFNIKLSCVSPSRPGYFFRHSPFPPANAVDFEIHCPNPECILASSEWFEMIPVPEKRIYVDPLEPFKIDSKPGYGHGIPISAFTVDSQIYSKCPSVIIATVDKFARLPFEPLSSSIFGNVDIYDTVWGYGRDISPPDTGKARKGTRIKIKRFTPPDLIIQDELHLIEGPLGSMVGLYECAIDALSSYSVSGKTIKPKYIASTATTRNAHDQIKCLYNRTLFQFPPSGLSATDNFFSQYRERHHLEDKDPGRLYVGVCCPGQGPQTPLVRIWALFLEELQKLKNQGQNSHDLKNFWTIVGYFNAVRELAQAAKNYREDIPLRMREPEHIAHLRDLENRMPLELSSNKDSSEIPSILEQLERDDDPVDAVFATSMFGTGVDIDRLSLMIVHGQPKSTSSYIQATGRVGRKIGGLVVTFLRSTRTRDLDHYEFFTGYHRSMYRYVEPVTVYPFSPRAYEKALGPVAVALLRNGSEILGTSINPEWTEDNHQNKIKIKGGPSRMISHRTDPEILAILKVFEERARNQSQFRKPVDGSIEKFLNSEFEKWENFAKSYPDLRYSESTYSRKPKYRVVLGDFRHRVSVFDKTPQSMRDVEQITRFGGR